MNPTKTHFPRLPKSTLLLLVLVVVMVLMLCTLCAYRFALRGSFGGEEPQPSVQLSADVTEPAPQPSAVSFALPTTPSPPRRPPPEPSRLWPAGTVRS